MFKSGQGTGEGNYHRSQPLRISKVKFLPVAALDRIRAFSGQPPACGWRPDPKKGDTFWRGKGSRHPTPRASQTASCSRGRKSRIRVSVHLGCTRLVSKTTITPVFGSTQKEVPVYPRCPKLEDEKCFPQEGCVASGVSNPIVRCRAAAAVVNRRISGAGHSPAGAPW